jgi:hypothetical protein
VRAQSKWVHDVDSYHNPYRAPLRHLAKIFFIWPVNQRQLMVGLTALATLSLITALVKRRSAPVLTFVIFAPFAIMAWIILDYETAARYAIPYLAAHALLAADALGLFARRHPNVQAALVRDRRRCVSRSGPGRPCSCSGGAIRRRSPALEWVRRNVPVSEKVFIHGGIGPQAQAIVPDRPNAVFYNESGRSHCCRARPGWSTCVWFPKARAFSGRAATRSGRSCAAATSKRRSAA